MTISRNIFFYEYLRCQRRILTPLSFSNGNVGRYASIVGYQFAQFSSLNDGDPRMMIFFMPIFSRPSHSCKHDGPVANSNPVTRQGYLVFTRRSHICTISAKSACSALNRHLRSQNRHLNRPRRFPRSFRTLGALDRRAVGMAVLLRHRALRDRGAPKSPIPVSRWL